MLCVLWYLWQYVKNSFKGARPKISNLLVALGIMEQLVHYLWNAHTLRHWPIWLNFCVVSMYYVLLYTNYDSTGRQVWTMGNVGDPTDDTVHSDQYCRKEISGRWRSVRTSFEPPTIFTHVCSMRKAIFSDDHGRPQIAITPTNPVVEVTCREKEK